MVMVERERFIGAHDGQSYLFTAAEGLVPRTVNEATKRYYEHKTDPVAGRTHHAEVGAELRGRLARLHGGEPGDIALLGNASQGISAIYALIDWRPGDNIVLVTSELEFPSVGLPALKRVAMGEVEVRIVEHSNWVIEPEAVIDAVDERSRLVFASHVSYRTGFRLDIEAIGDQLEGSGTIFAVDATQSLGALPVPASSCDFVVSTSGKWMLGPYGVGPLYWNRDRLPDVEPADIGWYSVIDDLAQPYELKPDAGRFEVGSLDWPAIYALNEGLKVIEEVGVENIERHVTKLAGDLLDQLREFDLDVITSPDPVHRSGIVSWRDADPAAAASRLAEHGVFVTGSSGRIRSAFHLYNDESDVERLVGALSDIL
ncbi:MAG: aminotransferase class V-fold PLP-dependent enzyme [Thermomicrobiales bacterium]